MDFTYQAYRGFVDLLKSNGYAFRGYHDYSACQRCVILRHDIDNSLSQAVRLAELEAELGVKSTYFVLLRTDFYNAASKVGQAALRRILKLGHELGLHFDEVGYGRELTEEETRQLILKESSILSTLLDTPITTVSMHRPSKATLEADLQIPGIVNTYGKTFFHDFKYLSDSRRRWREPVEDVIRSGACDRLHVLTHAFWYHEQDEDIAQTVGEFIRSASHDRYEQMMENITDLPAILPPAPASAVSELQLTPEQRLHQQYFHALETSRLLLRPLSDSDADAMFSYTSRPESFLFLRGEPHSSPEEDLAFIRRAENAYRTHRDFLWGIVELRSGTLIGTCRLFGLSAADGRGEVSYLLHPDHQGQGFASEAVEALVRYAFEELRLNRVQARCVSGNIGSERVMQKCGMQLEGTLRSYASFHGRLEDFKLYAIVRENHA